MNARYPAPVLWLIDLNRDSVGAAAIIAFASSGRLDFALRSEPVRATVLDKQ
jgi:hypothetical protein